MLNRRPIDPAAQWPTYCATGRKLALACESAQDYVEKAKGRTIAKAREAKAEAEAEREQHLDTCAQCRDHRVQSQARQRATRRRNKPVRLDTTDRSSIRPVPNESAVLYALRRLDCRFIS